MRAFGAAAMLPVLKESWALSKEITGMKVAKATYCYILCTDIKTSLL
jgi:hypothetical protein